MEAQNNEMDVFREGYSIGYDGAHHKIENRHYRQSPFWLGFLLGKTSKPLRKIHELEMTAQGLLAASLVLILMSLFELTLWGYMHFLLIFACGAISCGLAVHLRKYVRQVKSEAEAFKSSALLNEMDGVLLSTTEKLLKHALGDRQTINRAVLFGTPYLYWRMKWKLWLISVTVPIYYSLSIVHSNINGENGWYNYLGTNILGW